MLEQQLERICQRVREGVRRIIEPPYLHALVLGGGYGRGEGGVYRTEKGDQPYNDLEFYTLVRGSSLLAEHTFGGALHELAENVSEEAALDVEFKVTTLAKLRRTPPTMFAYDLVSGSYRLAGPDDLFARCPRVADAAEIPLSEATRLLMNRCSGLLFSAERLRRAQFHETDADFIARNIAKAELALGDVLLTCHGQYHWSVLQRQDRLRNLSVPGPPDWLAQVQECHRAGVEFKLHPVRSRESRQELSARHARLCFLAEDVWLWLERRRLNHPFESIRGYAESAIDKCPETNPLKNRLLNWRLFGLGGLSNTSAARYPRERLLHALVLMLFEPAACSRPDILRSIQRALQTEATRLSELVDVYRRLWNRFN